MRELDITRVPRGWLAAQELVATVADHGDLVERHYLELKSTLDLSEKRDKEKIAKFILGSANRMPEVAATAFEGYGIMIIGVSHDSITGIPPVEMLDISKNVQQFVGASGPRWDIMWVPIEGSTNQVLLVIVDPPEIGQYPFPCRANGDSLKSGRIYIRADGETREANADEFDLLLTRGSSFPKTEVDMEVEIIGDISAASIDDESTVEQYIKRITDQLLAALPSNEPFSPQRGSGPYALGPLKSSMSFDLFKTPEDRSEEEYLDAIKSWENNFRDAWKTAKEEIIVSQLTSIVVKITNRTTTFFHDVKVKLHLEGEVFAFDYVDPEMMRTFLDLDLPKAPRKWGPRQSMPHTFHPGFPSGLSPALPRNYTVPSVSFRNSGSVDLDLDIGELRPLGNYDSEEEEFVLVVADKGLTSIHGTWQFTARGHNEVYSGEIDVPVGEMRDFTNFARDILKLSGDDDS